MLLGDDGYVKLTDFGLSKEIEQATQTFCGTPEYLAPEIIRREAYSFPVDWWSLGILTYELIFGSTPFVSQNRSRMFTKITAEDPEYPKGTDPVVIGFINGLLTKNPNKRYGFKDIKADPFEKRYFNSNVRFRLKVVKQYFDILASFTNINI